MSMLYAHTVERETDRQTEQNVKNDDLLSGISRSKWDEHEHALLLVRKKKSKQIREIVPRWC